MELRRQQLQPLFQISTREEVRNNATDATIPFLKGQHTHPSHQPKERHQGNRLRQTGHRPEILRGQRRRSRLQNDGRIPNLRRQNLLHSSSFRHHRPTRLPSFFRRSHDYHIKLRLFILGPRLYDYGLASRRYVRYGREGDGGWIRA